MTARSAAAAAAAGGAGAVEGEKKEGEVDGDDEIPDLVENFEEAGEVKASDLEELE
jgi:nascent polypeptide-associated complex subunit beta